MKRLLSPLPHAALFVSIATMCFLCTNSPFDPASDLGTGILGDEDSSLIDMERNFHSFSSFLTVTSKGSFIPDNGGLHDSATTLNVGPWREETATAYLLFDGKSVHDIIGDPRDTVYSVDLVLNSDSALTIDPASPWLTISAAKAKPVNQAYDAVALAADVITGSFSVSDSDTTRLDIAIDTGYFQGMTGLIVEYDTTWKYVTSYDTALADSVIDTLVDSVATRIEDFGFAVSSTDSLVFFKGMGWSTGPHLIIRYMDTYDSLVIEQSDTTDTVEVQKLDTLKLYAKVSDYTVTETSPSANNDKLLSSSSSGRRAVVELDWSPFWQEMQNNATGYEFKDILETSVTFTVDSVDAKLSNRVFFAVDLRTSNRQVFDTDSFPKVTFDRDSAGADFASDTSIEVSIYAPYRLLRSSLPPKTYLYFVVPESYDFRRVTWPDAGFNSLKVNAVFTSPR